MPNHELEAAREDLNRPASCHTSECGDYMPPCAHVKRVWEAFENAPHWIVCGCCGYEKPAGEECGLPCV